jgi:hypothetical protein
MSELLERENAHFRPDRQGQSTAPDRARERPRRRPAGYEPFRIEALFHLWHQLPT